MDHNFLQMLQKYNTDSAQKPISERISAPGRFRDFSLESDGLLLDFSRTNLDHKALAYLLDMLRERGLEKARSNLFNGKNLNFTEQQPALHMAMRNAEVLRQLGAEEFTRVTQSRARMLDYASAFAAGHLPGDVHQPLRHIIHIGIGGSMLGPRMLAEVLGSKEVPQVHFLSSIDAQPRTELLRSLDPAETAVVVASKSFTTGETLSHARRVLQWVRQALGAEASTERVFAISGNLQAATEFGVAAGNIFHLPEWVGGRYSVWSAVSLSAAGTLGEGVFNQFLSGAAAMDRHFQSAPLAHNLPVMMALVDVWHRNICGYPAQAIIPYDHRLRSLPAYLQQLLMESNGKSTDSRGRAVACQTSPVVLGEVGTDAQHSLFQMFHQGTDIVPLHFIGVIRPAHEDEGTQAGLLSNMLAQATTLALGSVGRKVQDVHRKMPGGRPSQIILLDELNAFNLGRLLAMYEHKVFVESVIWGINAFDQFGVELGKVVANTIQPALEDPKQKLSASYGLGALLEYIHSKKQA